MLYWIAELFKTANEFGEHTTWLRLFDYTTFRAAGAFGLALIISLAFGPLTVHLLKKFRAVAASRHKEYSPELVNAIKDKTPSMGGILILVSILVSTLMWAKLDNVLVWTFLAVMVSLGILGFCDDYYKVAKKRADGIAPRTKMFFQILIACGAVLFLWSRGSGTAQISDLMIPFLKDPLTLPIDFLDQFARETLRFNTIVTNGFLAALIAFGLSVGCVIGTSNAVNLTDGKDGLASGNLIICATVYVIIAFLCTHQTFSTYLNVPFIPMATEVIVFTAALIGACLGYLWWNCLPASMFMGDTGSLALGGCIGLIAVLVRQELLMLIVGGVFVVEALSVMLQVFWFKRTGKRIFLCAPIHHHFEKLGWVESQIVARFWIIGIILAVIGLATLKLR